MSSFNLLSVSADAKTVKGEDKGYLTGILYLAPFTTGGTFVNVCPNATAGCMASCLFTAGRGQMSNVRKGRIRKTRMFVNDPVNFRIQLDMDIRRLVKRASNLNLIPAVRLNGTSDVDWTNIVQKHDDVQFYDYTKNFERMVQYVKGLLPANYHLTFSRSEKTTSVEMDTVLSNAGNVAVPFFVKKGEPLPTFWNGADVIDGDTSDLRFLDDCGVIVGLRAKGKAKKDTTGFVVRSF